MTTLDAEGFDLLFRKARTHAAWRDELVSDETLRRLYELLKWGPTSANSCPARILFLRSRAAKERLRPALSSGNVDKTMAAPVTAILAYDERFYEHLAWLFPHNPKIAQVFEGSPSLAETTSFRNGTLQGGYFILAARALGLDCGPMSGFDNEKVDREFFSAQAPEGPEIPSDRSGHVRSNFLVNLGYGDPAKLWPRGPRFGFDDVCEIL